MPQFPWNDHESESPLSPLEAFLAEWDDPEAEEEEFRSDFFQGLEGRRKKAAFALMLIWTVVISLHYWVWGSWLVWGLMGILSLQALRLMKATPEQSPVALDQGATLDRYQTVSLLVAAKNEEAVIGQLVTQLCALDYPTNCYDIWIVDDNSTDKTPAILDRLAQDYPQLNVVHRPAGSGGGKSGALNELLSQAQGAIIGVFDADASVPPDLLRQVVPYFEASDFGALQVRKAIANQGVNFWTKGQAAEMALDTYFQQQRIVTGGIGELRGNGQFVSRQALDNVGGWNEQTITDDLDLTIRLHLNNWKVGILVNPPVEEEGVTTAIALWHQRNRWAEGGYQRYLDYWRYIMTQPMGWRKKVDLVSFMLMQYLLPAAAVPDLLMAVWRHRLPLLTPLTYVAVSFSCWGMYHGLRRLTPAPPQSPWQRTGSLLGETVLGTFYMFHWLVVMPAVTARMAFRAKRLKWVKTVHGNVNDDGLELKQS
ncbi:MAG: UDPglucose:diacylglycerol glucosyltransferase [Cyanobacteriota bacterium]|jgi:1,2-diacylglycerol 3-beta-glucosyltransferase